MIKTAKISIQPFEICLLTQKLPEKLLRKSVQLKLTIESVFQLKMFQVLWTKLNTAVCGFLSLHFHKI